MFDKVIYTIEGESGAYIGQTNSLRRRLEEHRRSGMLRNLTNSDDHPLKMAIQKRLSVVAIPTNNPNRDERDAVRRYKGELWNTLLI